MALGLREGTIASELGKIYRNRRERRDKVEQTKVLIGVAVCRSSDWRVRALGLRVKKKGEQQRVLFLPFFSLAHGSAGAGPGSASSCCILMSQAMATMVDMVMHVVVGRCSIGHGRWRHGVPTVHRSGR